MHLSSPAEAPAWKALVAEHCRLTMIDRMALGLAGAFAFLAGALAITAYVAIGDAPEARMWGFLVTWAAIGFGVGIAAPWALCRSINVAGHAAQIGWDRRAMRSREAQPMGFFQGRMA